MSIPIWSSRRLTAEQLGNPARFVIEEKVSLPRQQSAMIPILDQAIDATRVSIYNRNDHAKHPLFGLKMKNNSKQSLMQGPIAVYDEGHYAGDSRILDLQPGEERFVSYGIDTGVEVAPFEKVVPGPEMTVRTERQSLAGALQIANHAHVRHQEPVAASPQDCHRTTLPRGLEVRGGPQIRPKRRGWKGRRHRNDLEVRRRGEAQRTHSRSVPLQRRRHGRRDRQVRSERENCRAAILSSGPSKSIWPVSSRRSGSKSGSIPNGRRMERSASKSSTMASLR